MKNNLLNILVFLLLSTSVYSQETFFKFVYGWRSHHIIEINNSFRVCGLSMNSNYNNYTYIEAISENADSISSFSLPVDTAIHEFRYNNSFAKTSTSNYVASYFVESITEEIRGLLMKYNEDYSDTINTKVLNIGLDGTMLWTIVQKNDTSLILGSFNKNGDNLYTTFLETDTLGNIRWQKDFDCWGDCNLSPFHILPTVDNGFIFTCYEDHINGSPGVEDVQMAIIKTDSVGNQEWRHSWGGDTTKNFGSWVVPLDDGNYLYAWTDSQLSGYLGGDNNYATIRFIKFDIGGNVLWYKNMYNSLPTTGDPNTATTGYYYHISQMELMPDGNIIVAGESEQYTSGNAYYKGLLLKIDQDANLIWYRELLPPDLAYEDNPTSYQYMKIMGVTFTSDGGFALAGEYFSAPGGNIFPDGFQSAYIYKLDEHGCYEPNCHVGVEEIAKQKSSFTLVPNPASESLTLNILVQTGIQNPTVKIYNLTGKKIKQFKIQESELKIDISDLESGIYLVKVGTQMQKLVVE